MKRIIRQVFGTTRPKEIWGDLLTFERLVTKPIVHIVYWVGLGLLIIAAFAVAGITVGTVIKEGLPWGVLLALPFFIVGMLSILVGVLLWRGFCEFYLAVMSIADDLRHLRQYQEKLVQPEPRAYAASETPEAAAPEAAAPVADAPSPTVSDPEKNLLEDPFFRPRFEKREF
ncbi:DUF4282 domain-containing protein [Asticcacaulis benevestitus]|uniref:DUF4282 domain-containing protein n=1 Tax=Asticcacaulis benevestitus DSM 16100 = ATCC BAA-896 TaxID=1121022 RepID=V4NYI4_9CAUL|nr:DUF4282 domain-containing protein [Asticcacaulis benevestitus]ESQ80029.1 hypothetical protein ABENE_22540 [Asticcacaulis benevestitus DSM 16100 = ATCC BAA-896]